MKIRCLTGLCLSLVILLTAGAAAQSDQRTAAPATVALITTDIQLAKDGSYTETLHVEMRAGNDATAAQLGQVSIPYNASVQEVAVLDAHTHKADGRNLPVEASAIYDQAPSAGQAILVTSQRSKLMVFPQFAGGDTAVYTIKITARQALLENQFFTSEFFPRTVAYEEARETITAPRNFPLFVESHNVDFSKREEAGNIVYTWHYSAPHPDAEEAATLAPLEHTPRFFASSFKDYAELGRAYAVLTDPRRLVTSKVSALADQITKGADEPKAQAQKLYEWVSSHIRYVAIELGSGSFIPHDVDVILANGYGDCKDHDLLLQALLKAKNIETQSVLLNGGDFYTLTDVPTFTTLDHVITFVPRFNLYLDSTAQVAPFGILPMQEYGKPMVVASTASAHSGTMPLLPPGLAKITYKMAGSLDKNGQISGTSSTSAEGPYVITLRDIGMAIQATGPTAGNKLLAAQGFADASATFSQDSPTGFEPAFRISSTFKASGWSDEAAGKYSFYIPGLMRLFARSGDAVMGSSDPGKLNLDEAIPCFSVSMTEDMSLKAPAGTKFQKVPNGLEVKTPNLEFTARWSLENDTMSVHREFTSHISEQFCRGTVRRETAAAIKKIAESYDTNISLASPEEMARDTSPEAQASQALYTTASAHFNTGEYDAAIADFTKLITMNPNSGSTYHDRGTALLRTRQYDLAIADFSKAIALGPDEPESYVNRGVAEHNTRQYTAAITDFDKAALLQPDNAAIYQFRGKAHFAVGQIGSAIADFDKVIALKPDNVDAFVTRAELRMNTKEFSLAIADFSSALKLRPGDIDILNERGFSYRGAGQFELAIADYDKVIAQRPNLSSAYMYRGDAKTKLGRKAEGDADLATAVELDPTLKN